MPESKAAAPALPFRAEVEAIGALEPGLRSLADADLGARGRASRERAARGEPLAELARRNPRARLT